MVPKPVIRLSALKFLQSSDKNRPPAPARCCGDSPCLSAAGAIFVAVLDVEETPDGGELLSPPPLEAPPEHRVGQATPQVARSNLKIEDILVFFMSLVVAYLAKS